MFMIYVINDIQIDIYSLTVKRGVRNYYKIKDNFFINTHDIQKMSKYQYNLVVIQ